MAFAAGVSIACSASRSVTPAQTADATPNTQAAMPSVNAAAQEKSPCMLSMSQVPVLHGLKLGITADEVLALFPGGKEDPQVRSYLSTPPSNVGTSQFVITPSKYDSGERFTGISQITFTLLDGRVSNFTVGYNGPEWPHVDRFVARFVEGTNLPAPNLWEPYVGMDYQLKTLTCTDFSIRVFAGGAGGNLNYVELRDLEADKKLKERRRKAREQASPTPEQ